jgi:rare lipoprotein A
MWWRLRLDVSSSWCSAQAFAVCGALFLARSVAAQPAAAPVQHGTASWYGEAHRGKRMANGKPFDPDELTAASWPYPLGTRLRVSLRSVGAPSKSVVVTLTDRGPSARLLKEGRIIDLSCAAFARLASPQRGLLQVSVCRIDGEAAPGDALILPGNVQTNGPPLKGALVQTASQQPLQKDSDRPENRK